MQVILSRTVTRGLAEYDDPRVVMARYSWMLRAIPSMTSHIAMNVSQS